MGAMSTSTATATTPTTPVNEDGVLRAFDLSRLDPADTLTFDHSVAQIFRSATRPGAAPHPFRDQAVATVLLLAAANSVRQRTHYRELAHSPRFASPWDLPRIEYFMEKNLHEDLVKTDPSTLLRRAKTESWLRRYNEDLSSKGAEAARKFLDSHEGLEEKLGPVVVEHFIRAASILPPPAPGVVNSPAPSHRDLLHYIGEVGGLSALDLIGNINIEIGTAQIADRARTIPGLAGVGVDRWSVLLSTRSGLTAKIGGSQARLALQGAEGAREHRTIPIQRQSSTVDGIHAGLCRALTEHAGAGVLPEGMTARTLVDRVLSIDFPLDAVHVTVLVGEQGPTGIGINSHTSRALVGQAFLQEWCAENGHDYDQTLALIQQLRTGLLSGPDAELFAALTSAER